MWRPEPQAATGAAGHDEPGCPSGAGFQCRATLRWHLLSHSQGTRQVTVPLSCLVSSSCPGESMFEYTLLLLGRGHRPTYHAPTGTIALCRGKLLAQEIVLAWKWHGPTGMPVHMYVHTCGAGQRT